MKDAAFFERRKLESLEPWALRQHQFARLNALLATILPTNRLYAEKLGVISAASSVNCQVFTHQSQSSAVSSTIIGRPLVPEVW